MREDEAGGERVVLAELEVSGGHERVAVTQPHERHGRVPHLYVTGHSGPHARHEGPEVKGLDGGWH